MARSNRSNSSNRSMASPSTTQSPGNVSGFTQTRNFDTLKTYSVALIAAIGIGFGAGVYVVNQDAKMDKISMNQDCNERVRSEVENCRKEKDIQVGEKIKNLEEVVKDLKSKQNK